MNAPSCGWEAAVRVAPAHLVAASQDRPVTLPVGPVAERLGDERVRRQDLADGAVGTAVTLGQRERSWPCWTVRPVPPTVRR
ncbi:hypothetical protein OG897_29070 [Streptomyces sp. NBC_00237]|uniref:hypothetical protein n=1 Tax=Streptomyces sp. NBC_00237 TaxID=2975687 RepID=UPI00224EADAB|nr:hypothetical protein [Streptomyces sp. NBC_00237]MCX5205498.1 hypothetical protein [Streptomyces sp. NBC_00237]